MIGLIIWVLRFDVGLSLKGPDEANRPDKVIWSNRSKDQFEYGYDETNRPDRVIWLD